MVLRDAVAEAEVPGAVAGEAEPGTPGGRTLAFRGVRIFDGERGCGEGAVVVQGGRVAEAGPGARVPEGAAVVEGRGLTLLPGLIDGHVHVLAAEGLRQQAVLGITTCIDLFMDVRLLAALKARQAEDGAPGLADFFSAGMLATAPGGHGNEYGLPLEPLVHPDQAEGWVEARVAEGSDFFKVILDDGEQHGLDFPTVGRPTLEALVRAAHARGKLVVAHISTLRDAREAIEAGVDGLAHVFMDRDPDPDFGRFAADHGIFVSPTLCSILATLGVASGKDIADDPRVEPYLAPRSRTNLRHAYPTAPGVRLSYPFAEAAVRALRDAGVPLLAGSDVPNPGTAYGATLHRELELLVSAGLTPAEALAAATSAPARAYRLDDRGRLGPGLRADLLLVRGDPLADVTAARDVAGVWKAGAAVDREAYHAEVAREKARVSTLPPPPEGSESGFVSDFDGVGRVARFGFGWAVSTDRIIGGDSTAEIHVVEGGAREAGGCLRVRGEIRPGAPFPWAGAIFHPGRTPVEPANLSAFSAISFWARGDGPARVVVFARCLGLVPSIRPFDTGPEWREYRFPLRDFSGLEGTDIVGVLFSGGPAHGEFGFCIDDVCFV